LSKTLSQDRSDPLANDSASPWLAPLDEQDLHFLKRFLLASGSLKDVANEYEVS